MYPTTDAATRKFYLLLATALTLLISACAGQKTKEPVAQEPPGETAAPTSVAQLKQWTIKGKLGVRSPADNGSANLTWQQSGPQNFRIHLSGPLGAGTTIISGSAGGVSLVRGNEAPVVARDAAQLTQQTLGWPLPAREMFYWVRGLPAPGPRGAEKHNGQGELQSLQQSGWSLRFSDYRQNGPYLLPTRIKAQTNGAAGPVQVTLVIKDWAF
ncbi:lipoprotein insertase outer membrane protein LolB [Microbulbifer variabilis]|uniref:Outer-membrane lipoprotein LolB n=1 Tax=Microbulbifer variabilis TaxID=266805 RepID=A0ABY4V8M7_9GAMM|nr:lipoprotein insertase outer membrane protein LolB [Microbulbifer variabilis]USD20620.1 lipoprotein insertase outer membrane protein LolB [Microbulbifer variabilis]